MTASENESNAYHLACRLLAESLNDQGLEMKKVFEVKEVDVPWTGDSIEDVLMKPALEAMYGIKSSKKANPSQLGKAYEVITRHLMSSLGADCPPFPHREEL